MFKSQIKYNILNNCIPTFKKDLSFNDLRVGRFMHDD